MKNNKDKNTLIIYIIMYIIIYIITYRLKQCITHAANNINEENISVEVRYTQNMIEGLML